MALRRYIIRRCEQLDYASFQNMILEESRRFNHNPEVITRVTYARMRTSMRNARLRNFPNPPRTLRELTEILHDQQYEVLTMTDDGTENIYGGSVTDTNGDHHILFVSPRMLQRMQMFSVLHSDGTFRAVPVSDTFAAQIFCIIGVWNNHRVPLAWVIMSSRTEVAYTAVLQLLSHLLGDERELQRVITDFETGQQNAWEQVFRVQVQGCLWHLCRAFIQQVAEYNLIRHMRRINEVRHIIRLTLSIALLPEDMIVLGYRVILDHARNEGRYIYRLVFPFLLYVWRYWVSRHWRRQRMCVFRSKQRTNNACEAHNRMLNDEVGTHSNVYRFIGGIVRLEQRSYNTMLALDAGRRVSRPRRRTSVFNDQRVQNFSNELFNPPGTLRATVFRFLRGVSHTMDGMVEDFIQEKERR